MRVLWITNFMLQEQASYLGVKGIVNEGWVKAAAEQMKQKNSDITISFATVYSGSELLSFESHGVSYYLVPLFGKKRETYSKKTEQYWKEVYTNSKAEVVHIHGTEYAHGLAFLNACPQAKVVFSIQGLISVCKDHYNDGLSRWDILNSVTLGDIYSHATLFELQRSFAKRGETEKMILKNAHYVIGRTSWDKEQVLNINPGLHYFFCNETLRQPFYNNSWSYSNCKKHSIFFSQATYPLKGFHMLLKAMPNIIREYPDAHIYVAGNNETAAKTIKQKLTLSGYGKILRGLIKKHSLEDRITFMGALSAEEMCKAYLQSNVFVCCSSIENSPNSVCEAQILGVPCVAPFVGGVPDMIEIKKTGLIYDYKDTCMLAAAIKSIFALKETVNTLPGKEIAHLRHDPIKNATDLIEIYRTILHSEEND